MGLSEHPQELLSRACTSSRSPCSPAIPAPAAISVSVTWEQSSSSCSAAQRWPAWHERSREGSSRSTTLGSVPIASTPNKQNIPEEPERVIP